MDARDEQVLFDAIFDIKKGVGDILRLLTEDDEDEAEEDEP